MPPGESRSNPRPTPLPGSGGPRHTRNSPTDPREPSRLQQRLQGAFLTIIGIAGIVGGVLFSIEAPRFTPVPVVFLTFWLVMVIVGRILFTGLNKLRAAGVGAPAPEQVRAAAAVAGIVVAVGMMGFAATSTNGVGIAQAAPCPGGGPATCGPTAPELTFTPPQAQTTAPAQQGGQQGGQDQNGIATSPRSGGDNGPGIQAQTPQFGTPGQQAPDVPGNEPDQPTQGGQPQQGQQTGQQNPVRTTAPRRPDQQTGQQDATQSQPSKPTVTVTKTESQCPVPGAGGNGAAPGGTGPATDVGSSGPDSGDGEEKQGAPSWAYLVAEATGILTGRRRTAGSQSTPVGTTPEAAATVVSRSHQQTPVNTSSATTPPQEASPVAAGEPFAGVVVSSDGFVYTPVSGQPTEATRTYQVLSSQQIADIGDPGDAMPASPNTNPPDDTEAQPMHNPAPSPSPNTAPTPGQAAGGGGDSGVSESQPDTESPTQRPPATQVGYPDPVPTPETGFDTGPAKNIPILGPLLQFISGLVGLIAGILSIIGAIGRGLQGIGNFFKGQWNDLNQFLDGAGKVSDSVVDGIMKAIGEFLKNLPEQTREALRRWITEALPQILQALRGAQPAPGAPSTPATPPIPNPGTGTPAVPQPGSPDPGTPIPGQPRTPVVPRPTEPVTPGVPALPPGSIDPATGFPVQPTPPRPNTTPAPGAATPPSASKNDGAPAPQPPKPNKPPRPKPQPTMPPPKPGSDGGPGEWVFTNEGTADTATMDAARIFQQLVTLVSYLYSYYVNGVKFDGYFNNVPGLGKTLVDAKNSLGTGYAALAGPNGAPANLADKPWLEGMFSGLVDQALAQINALNQLPDGGSSVNLVWVANNPAAQAGIKAALATLGSAAQKITVLTLDQWNALFGR